MLNDYHAQPERFDDKLDAEYLRQQAEVLLRKPYIDFRSQPYFSPSAANSCPRGLYEKLRGAKRDKRMQQPHQGRWTRIGTAWGDLLQRDLLFIEKYVANPPFVPERTPDGYPAWENFVRKMHVVDAGANTFGIFGKPDGILHHVATGRRVGLEIKSKQTTPSRTSPYSMRAPQADHVAQVVAYAIMYGLTDYLVVYGNLAKKAWVMTPDEAAKNPDLRVFHVVVTDAMKQALIDRFAGIVQAAREGNPPALDLSKWTFNNYKTACAVGLSADELTALARQVHEAQHSSLPAWKINAYSEALAEIKAIREAVA